MYKEFGEKRTHRPLAPTPRVGALAATLPIQKEEEDTSTIVQAPQTRRELIPTGFVGPLQRNM